jgi:antirestriction protein ArdC
MTKAKKSDAYEMVTNEIIKSLEKGIVPWKKPWNVEGGLMPINVANNKPYNGINVLILACQPYASNVWGTFKQWKDKGGYVRKGEESTVVCFWKFLTKKDENGDIEYDSKGREMKIPLLRYYRIFNAEQIEGIELDKYTPQPIEPNEFTPIAKAEKIVAEMPNCPTIKHGGNVACYSPSLDIVNMPKAEQFHSNGEYYSTLFHELSHSTGHKTRVGRDLSPTSFGSESYSKEELVAEISACFLCSNVGIEQTFDNSTAYIKGWLKKLKDDKKLIISAASQAKKSATYIMGNAETEKKTTKELETA